MTTLPLYKISPSERLVSPDEFSDVRLDSSALALFTDFRRHEPFVIDGWMGAVDAECYMRKTHTRLRMVVDHDGKFIGTITLADLSERRLLKKVAAGESRYDIRVMDLMTPRQELKTLAYADVCGATVQDVLHTLSCNGEQHCLVVDFDGHSIRGVIATSDVARRLHMDVQFHVAPSFAEIFSAVHLKKTAEM